MVKRSTRYWIVRSNFWDVLFLDVWVIVRSERLSEASGMIPQHFAVRGVWTYSCVETGSQTSQTLAGYSKLSRVITVNYR